MKYGKSVAINDLSLTVDDGDSLIIMGPNGSGKTTLLKSILGLVKYEGFIGVNGQDVSSISRKNLAREIAYIPQIFSTPYTFSVREFVSMGEYSLSRNWSSDESKISSILDKVGIYELGDKTISSLSGGELQKCIIARALIQDSKYLLMDEPTAHLDIKSVLDILDIVSSLKEKGVMIVSHDLNALNRLGGAMILMKHGKIVFGGYKEDPAFGSKIAETFGAGIGKVGDYLYFPLTQIEPQP